MDIESARDGAGANGAVGLPSTALPGAPSFSDLLEQARRDDPAMFVTKQIMLVSEIARASGVTRDDLAATFLTASVRLARPDAASRSALARHLLKQVRFLDATALDEAAPEW